MRKHVIHLLIHKDPESGKLVYQRHCLESIMKSISKVSPEDYGVLLFLNGGVWTTDFKNEIGRILSLDFIQFIDSDKMLNIGRVRNIMSHEYYVSEYFTMMDNDDEIPDYFHSKLNNLLEFNNYEILRWKVRWVNKDTSIDIPNVDHFKKHLAMYDYLPNFSYLINRESYISSKVMYPEDMIVREDSLWSVMINARFCNIDLLPEVMYIYRHDLSVMSKDQRDKKREVFEQVGNAINYILKGLYDKCDLADINVINKE